MIPAIISFALCSARLNGKQLIEDVRRLALKYFPGDPSGGARPEVTGIFVLLARLVDSVLADQLKTILVASAAIALVMLIAFRSFVLAIAALITNLIPIAIVLGLLGWLGIKMNMGAAMIAAVSLGLSIDSSIHYIWSFRLSLSRGSDVSGAILFAQQRVGRAALMSTMALVVGFSSLAVSQFIPTVYFGVLVCLSMLGGLLGNLVVLPILLNLFAQGPRTKSATTATTDV